MQYEQRITVAMAESFNERFMRSTGRHFVTLSCVQVVCRDPLEEKVLVFSGFLVDIGGIWFYVTAGHILKRIDLALAAGAAFETWRLGDQTAGNRFKNIAIPFHFDRSRWFVLEKEEIGLDYAVVPLEPMYCKLLEAGGAVPIAKEAWADYITEHDQWALVGIPSESVSYDGKTLITARVVVAPLTQVDEPPAEAGGKTQNQFYGRLKDDSERILQDVDGMSGGPIFALKKTGEDWKYAVIGVQSGWYRSRRIVAACPFSSLGLALQDVVAEVLSKLDGNT